MSRHICIVLFAVTLLAPFAFSQKEADSSLIHPLVVNQLLGASEAVPEGYSIRMTGAVPPGHPVLSTVAISVGMGGLFEVSFRHDGLLGTPIGRLLPSNEIGMRLQILPQRPASTGVSVFFNTMMDMQHNILGNADLAANLPGIYNMGVEWMSYDAKTTVAGLTFSTAVNEMLSVSGSLGVREVWWKQQFTRYRIRTSLPTTPDGWTFPLGEQTSYGLHWSIALAFQPIPQLAFLAEAHTLPFMDIDESTYLLTPRQGIEAAFGIRYTLTPGINLLLYDRWYSEGGTRTHYHEIRLGVSIDMSIFSSH